MPFDRLVRKSRARSWSAIKGFACRLWRHPWILAFLLVAAFVVGLAFLLFTCRGATHIRLRFAADRLAFTVAEAEARVLDDPLPFELLLIEDFERLTLDVTRLRLASPSAADAPAAGGPAAGSPDAGGWLDADGPVTLSPRSEHASLLLRGPGRLGRLRTPAGSRVVLEAHGARPAELTVKVDFGQRIQIAAGGELEIEGRLVALSGLPGPPIEGDSLRFVAGLAEDRMLTLESRYGGVTLGLLTGVPELFSGRPFSVGELELLRQELDGHTVSSLMRDAALTYPDGEREGSVLSPEQYLILEDLERGELTLTAIEEGSGGIAAVFDGLVGQIRAGTQGFSTDRCVTLWEGLRRNRLVAALVAILGWLGLGGVISLVKLICRRSYGGTWPCFRSKR